MTPAISKTVSVTLYGNAFTFLADSDFSLRLEALADETARRAALTATDRRRDPEATAAFLMHVLETLLGSGTANQLYGEVLPDPLVVCNDVCTVIDAYHAFRLSYIKRIQEEVS